MWDGCANLEFLVEELNRAQRAGVVCIVDGTHPDGVFVPKLRHAGVDAETLRGILAHNSRRFLV